MPFDFAEFLDVADRLVTHGDEAAWRSAISRAYYAVIHGAYEALPASLRVTISHGAIHRRTWQVYDASSVLACRRVGQAGWRLRNARVRADYQGGMAVTLAQARRFVVDARSVQALLDQHGYQP